MPRLEAEANARLIAAAPEMQEMLKVLEFSEIEDVGSRVFMCLSCWHDKDEGHKSDCKLKALLDKIDGSGS